MKRVFLLRYNTDRPDEYFSSVEGAKAAADASQSARGLPPVKKWEGGADGYYWSCWPGGYEIKTYRVNP